jgi:hypothetical protein
MSLESYSENQSSTLESDTKSEKPLDLSRGKEIYVEIDKKQKFLEELDTRMNKLVEDISDKDVETVSDAIKSLEAGDVIEDTFLSQFPEGSKTRDLAELVLKSMHEMRRIEELQEQHKPYVIKELNTLASNLESRFNWDNFLEQCDTGPTDSYEEKNRGKGLMYNTLSEFAMVREVQQQFLRDTISQNSYELLKSYQEELESSTERWQQRGFLSEQIQTYTELPSVEETRHQRLLLKTRLEEVENVAKNYASLKTRFRTLFNPHKFEDDLFEEVIRSLDVEKGYSHADGTWRAYDHDPRYLDAVQKFTARRIEQYVKNDRLPIFGEEYKAYIDKLRNTDTEAALSGITIKGFEESSGEVLVVTEENLRDNLRLLVPACFLENIELVIVKDKPEGVDKEGSGVEVMGVHTPEFDDKGNLVKSYIEIYQSPRVSESTDLMERSVVTSHFNSYVLHEIAHSIHYRLTYEDMTRWSDVMKKDSTAVTWYVEHIREKKASDELIEDFCETFQLAVFFPDRLYKLSPERFKYMMKFMSLYMGNEQRLKFFDHVGALLEKSLQSNEEIINSIEEKKEEQK